MRRAWIATALLLVAGTVAGCATVQEVLALRQVDFSLAGVTGGRLAGVDLSGVRGPEDISPAAAARLAASVASGDLPLEFTADVRAANPASNATSARLVRLQWTLLLNDRETIDGVVDREVVMPPGQPVTVPIAIRLDLLDFFEGNAAELLNLALTFAGADADPVSVKLRALPRVETPLGPIDYPAEITIAEG